MLADVIQEILASAARAGYKHGDEPIKLVVALKSGVVLRGHLVSADAWLAINSVAGQGRTWVGRREIPTPGSWPTDVKLPDEERAIQDAANKVAEREAAKKAAQEAEAKGDPEAAKKAARDAQDDGDQLSDPRYTMIFMTTVEYLSGDRWVNGSSMAMDVDSVEACGDQYS